jgi:hypothetical protein
MSNTIIEIEKCAKARERMGAKSEEKIKMSDVAIKFENVSKQYRLGLVRTRR